MVGVNISHSYFHSEGAYITWVKIKSHTGNERSWWFFSELVKAPLLSKYSGRIVYLGHWLTWEDFPRIRYDMYMDMFIYFRIYIP